MIGDKYNRLKVIEKLGTNKHNKRLWLCKCDCGNEVVVTTGGLRSGKTKSCGCLAKEEITKANRRYNKYIIDKDYIYVKLDCGEVVVLDLDMLDLVKSHKFRKRKDGYVALSIIVDGKYKSKLLHSLIIKNEHCNKYIDHINRNKLDNRICNLRVVTPQESQLNTGIDRNNKTGYKGICWDKKRQKYSVSICFDGCVQFLGRFENIEDAIKVRKEREYELFGEFIEETKRLIEAQPKLNEQLLKGEW